jgi:NADH:ubiquinone oxidoreductase subunit E
MALEFSPETYKKFEETVNRYPKKEAALLPVLSLAQKGLYLGQEAIEYVAATHGPVAARFMAVSFLYHAQHKALGGIIFRSARTLLLCTARR